MWFPVDPGQDQTLWDSFHDELASQRLCPVINAGAAHVEAHARLLGSAQVAATLATFHLADLVRLGVSRRRTMAPHGAFVLDGTIATLRELLTPPTAPGTLTAYSGESGGIDRTTPRDLARHVEALATAVFYGPAARGAARPEVTEVRVPLTLHLPSDGDVVTAHDETGVTIFRRATAAAQ